MENNFKYIIFSVFDVCDFILFTEIVNKIFKDEIDDGKADIYSKIPNIDEYINPQSGGSHLPKFSCWQSNIYSNKVFFISNYEDGLSNVCRIIQKHLKCCVTMCALSNDTVNPFFKFYFSDSNFKERLVQVYKEDKWVFYEEGTPLDIEDINYYRNNRIKKRLNNLIINEYLLNLGIDFTKIDNDIYRGIVYRRKRW